MSTILKTLKKLEEEKSVLEKKLDLKELVLQDEESFFIESSISRTFLLKSLLILAGIVLAIVWLWKDNPKQVVQVSQPKSVYLQQPAPEKKQSIGSVPGIPLSNIPEQVSPKYYPNPKSETGFFSAKKKNPEIIKRAVDPVKPPSPPARKNVQQEKGIFEIQSLIASAKSLAYEPEEIQIPQINRNVSIPGLKVKGIIFFSPKSPSNHIFVSTPKSKNQKVRVGDSIESATLMEIETNSAVFSYQEQMVRLNIGG